MFAAGNAVGNSHPTVANSVNLLLYLAMFQKKKKKIISTNRQFKLFKIADWFVSDLTDIRISKKSHKHTAKPGRKPSSKYFQWYSVISSGQILFLVHKL